MKLQTALARSFRAAVPEPSDVAAAELARAYAKAIDAEPEKLYLYGKLFLDAVTALGMTPKARAGLVKESAPATSGLDELRARRARSA